MRWGKYTDSNTYSSIKLDLKMPFRINLNFILMFIASSMLLTSGFAINDAFAINAYIITDEFEKNSPSELKWQMVFISSSPACSNYHYQMMNTYNDVAIQYLKLYEFENFSYDPLCFSEEKYLSNYQTPSDLDLLILVYDNDLGEKELHANKMGGLYTHSGNDRTQNHVIIICDCSNFDYSSPVWILSHELSHFILYYNDFEMTVIEKLIHVNDIKYDQCLKESTSCKSSSIKMRAGPGGYEYSVMPIYQPVVGKQTKSSPVNDVNSPVTSDISKIITQWWAKDIITDEQYSNAISYFVDSNTISSLEKADLILADEPFENVITWEQMMEEITPTYWDRASKSDDDSISYLSKIPNNMISQDEDLLLKNKNFGLPEWFKDTASWWGEDMITDIEFEKNIEYLVKQGIIEPHQSSVFQNLLVKSEPKHTSTSASPESKQDVPASLPQVSITETPSEAPVESMPEVVPVESIPEVVPVESIPEVVPVDIDGIFELYDFVSSNPEIDNSVMKHLLPTVIAFDNGNLEEGCNKLENLFEVFENLINSNKIEQSLGQSLIAEVELIKLDLCN